MLLAAASVDTSVRATYRYESVFAKWRTSLLADDVDGGGAVHSHLGVDVSPDLVIGIGVIRLQRVERNELHTHAVFARGALHVCGDNRRE